MAPEFPLLIESYPICMSGRFLQASQDLSRPKAERAFINSLFLGIGNNRDRPAVSLPKLVKQALEIGSAQALWIAQNTRLFLPHGHGRQTVL